MLFLRRYLSKGSVKLSVYCRIDRDHCVCHQRLFNEYPDDFKTDVLIFTFFMPDVTLTQTREQEIDHNGRVVSKQISIPAPTPFAANCKLHPF